MTQRSDYPRDRRLHVVAALYHDRPPPGASREVLSHWVHQRARHGATDAQLAAATGLDVQSVCRILGERSA